MENKFIYAREDQKEELEKLGCRYICEQFLNNEKYYMYITNRNLNFTEDDKSKYIISNTMYF